MQIETEAVLAMGLLCIVLGAPLLVLGLWWARRRARKDPALGKKVSFTAAGWIHLLAMLLMLFIGPMAHRLAPDSQLGQLLSSGLARVIWVLVVFALFAVAQKVLSSFGVPIERPGED